MSHSVLILGIGNVLWADEGFGVRCVETLNQRYEFPDNVKLMDGGTQGIYLVQHVQKADVLVVFDAIDYGLEPGTLKKIYNDDVPKFMGAKQMSLHQTGFQEVLAMAEFREDAVEPDVRRGLNEHWAISEAALELRCEAARDSLFSFQAICFSYRASDMAEEQGRE